MPCSFQMSSKVNQLYTHTHTHTHTHIYIYIHCFFRFFTHWASLVAQMINNLPAMQETGLQSLGWEDPLEKGMATQSSILAWRIPWTDHGVTKSWT